MYSYQDLEYLEKHSEGLKHAVVVGGGLIGIELAEMLHSRHIPTSFLVREKSFWSGVLPKGESEMVNREIFRNKIDLQLQTELKEILPDENGKVQSSNHDKGEEIPCQFVGLTAGVRPNVDFLKETNLKIERGNFGKQVFGNQYSRCLCHWRLRSTQRAKRRKKSRLRRCGTWAE